MATEESLVGDDGILSEENLLLTISDLFKETDIVAHIDDVILIEPEGNETTPLEQESTVRDAEESITTHCLLTPKNLRCDRTSLYGVGIFTEVPFMRSNPKLANAFILSQLQLLVQGITASAKTLPDQQEHEHVFLRCSKQQPHGTGILMLTFRYRFYPWVDSSEEKK